MRRIPLWFVLGAWCALTPVLACSQSAGKVTKTSGQGFVDKSVKSKAATVGDVLRTGDLLRTADGGRIRVQLNDGSILSLSQSTKLKIVKYDAKNQQSAFELAYGSVRANVIHLPAAGSGFEIRTDLCVVGILHGGDFAVETTPVATTVFTRTSQANVVCSNSGGPQRIEVPAGFYASSSDGVLHPLKDDSFAPFDLSYSRSTKLPIFFPRTTLVARILLETYVT